MFFNSNEKFLIRKNTYDRFAILIVVFMKKTACWGVTTYALIYRVNIFQDLVVSLSTWTTLKLLEML
jgi:hypothetical protein